MLKEHTVVVKIIHQITDQMFDITSSMIKTVLAKSGRTVGTVQCAKAQVWVKSKGTIDLPHDSGNHDALSE